MSRRQAVLNWFQFLFFLFFGRCQPDLGPPEAGPNVVTSNGEAVSSGGADLTSR